MEADLALVPVADDLRLMSSECKSDLEEGALGKQNLKQKEEQKNRDWKLKFHYCKATGLFIIKPDCLRAGGLFFRIRGGIITCSVDFSSLCDLKVKKHK